ncbi:MAG: hypothetical protein ABW175_02185 [Bradyrhizobium sp.]
MTIFIESSHPESRTPRTLAQAVSIHAVTLDMRRAMVELALASLTTSCAAVQGQIVARMRRSRAPRPEQGHEPCCC